MSGLSRRDLLRMGTQAAVCAALPRTLWSPSLLVDLGGPQPVPVPPIVDPDVKKLALRAVEASKAAGATYADVRLTHTYQARLIGDTADLNWQNRVWMKDERMHVGVRALVNGYWGFASSGIWTPDEMARLAKVAVLQAKTNALGKPRPVELAAVPPVANGHWVTPMKRDPFTMDLGEIIDVTSGMLAAALRYRPSRAVRGASWDFGDGTKFWRQAKAFASTAGSYCTQELYRSDGKFQALYRTTRDTGGMVDFLTPTGGGFELWLDHEDRQAAVWKLMDEIVEDASLPSLPVDVGRYDTVMDARATAYLLDRTLGRATELDRAMGYEANATGTSYLNDPLGMVGSYQAGSELVTLIANRNESGGCATVQWDDEGVVPEPFTVVKDGVLTDLHTTRESASWLQPYYGKQQQPVRSHGCAAAPTGLHAPLTYTPNLQLAPGKDAQDFDDLVGTLKDGLALKSWGFPLAQQFNVDFQCLNGLVLDSSVYKVEKGRRVAKLSDAGILFRSPELWKGVVALGGKESVRRYGMEEEKGEPPQATFHSVTAPPTLFKQLTLINSRRKP